MRILILIWVLSSLRAHGQRSFQSVDSASAALFQSAKWRELGSLGSQAEKDSLDYFTLNYRTGLAYYFLGQYSTAEHFLTRAFRQNGASKETGDYLYGALMEQGMDLEAARLQQHNPFISGSQGKKLLEATYLEGGIKMSSDQSASGNIYYYSLGLISRPGAGTRLWQAVSFLRQDKDGVGYRQYEYLLSVPVYLHDYWYLKPSVHWAYTDYNAVSNESEDFDSVYHQGPVTIHTFGSSNTRYHYDGRAHSVHAALSISRRYGPLTLEAEPSFHYINDRYDTRFARLMTGKKDSLINGHLLERADYQAADSGSNGDTTARFFIPQAGLSISYRLPFWQERITARLAAYYLSYEGSSELDFTIYGLIRFSDQFWVHLSYLHKDGLPLALSYEGQYFNAANPVKNKTSCSLQLFPLRTFSAIFTYQYEMQLTGYHSFYLSLKYSL